MPQVSELQPSVPGGINPEWTQTSTAPQPFLQTGFADGLSLLLFAGGALELTESLPFMASAPTAALAVAATVLGTNISTLFSNVVSDL